MRRLVTTLAILSVLPLAAEQAPGPNQPDPAMARMREGMKKLVQRISEADTGRVAAEAAKAEADAKVVDLEAKVKSLEKRASDLTIQSTNAQAAADKTIAELNAKLVAKEKQASQLTEALGKWKEGFAKAQAVAEGKEAERAAAAGKSAVLERRVADAETKNAEMHKLGTEILSRYEKFGLGTALLAREPFVRNMKVKFQNLVQDFGDKIDAQRIQPSNASSVKKDQPAPEKKN